MNVKQVAKNKSIIAAIVAMISILGAAETAYAGPCQTPCSDHVGEWFRNPDGGFICFDDGSGYLFTSVYGFQMRVSLDKDGCFLSREIYFQDDRNELTGGMREEGFGDCCGGPRLQTFLGSDGKTVTRVEKFGENGCLTETDAFVYDDKGHVKDEIISDQYYNCFLSTQTSLGVQGTGAGRVTHKTPSHEAGPLGPQQKTTEISLYDRDGHLVSVTTFDDQGRAKRSDARAPSAPSGQSEVPVSSLLPDGFIHGAGQVDSVGGVNTGRNQAVAPGSTSATGGTAGVVGTNAAVVRHPGQSFKGLKHDQGAGGPAGTGATAGVAGPSTDTATATGGTAGVAGPSATPYGGGNSASGGTAGVAGTAPVAMPTDASQREPMKSPSPAGRHLRKRLPVPITAGSPAPAPTPSGHGGGGHDGSEGSATGATAGVVGPGDNSSSRGNSASGGTAGVAGSSSGQTGGEKKRKIIWQKSSSAATDTGTSSSGGVHNSAIGGSGGKQTGDQMMKQRETGKGTKPTPTPTVVPR